MYEKYRISKNGTTERMYSDHKISKDTLDDYTIGMSDENDYAIGASIGAFKIHPHVENGVYVDTVITEDLAKQLKLMDFKMD